MIVEPYTQKNDFWAPEPHICRTCTLARHLNLGSSMVRAPYRSSEGCGFDPRLGLRSRFFEYRAWRSFIYPLKIFPSFHRSNIQTSYGNVYTDTKDKWHTMIEMVDSLYNNLDKYSCTICAFITTKGSFTRYDCSIRLSALMYPITWLEFSGRITTSVSE